jgi:ATP-dependent NAD(P)H-hydrate dehydratase
MLARHIVLLGSSLAPVSSFVHPTLSQFKNIYTATSHQMSSEPVCDAPSKWSDIFNRNSYAFSSDHLSSLIPKLSSTSHKGSHGRIAIFGGSEKYTGAPYYAASAALNCGVDLVTVFCAKEAATPIKCYSPELMVQSVYSVEELDAFVKDKSDKFLVSQQQTIDTVTAAFPSLHALCIGPGMGRHELLFHTVSKIIEKAIEYDLSLILDADALFMLSLDDYRDLLLRLLQYEKVIMTPNLMEFRRLQDALKDEMTDRTGDIHLNNMGLIVRKGSSDIITQQSMVLDCKEIGGLKRSGGIGDVLAGTISAFMAWNAILQKDASLQNKPSTEYQDRLFATWTACCTVKKATRKAFDKRKRSMSAQHVLEELGEVIMEMEQNLEDANNKVQP